MSHSSGIHTSEYRKLFFLHQSPYVLLAPLYNLDLELLKTNLMSRSGCCFCISKCLRLSAATNLPLVSTMIPLSSSMKSGVYFLLRTSNHSILTVSYSKLIPNCWRVTDTSSSSPDRYPSWIALALLLLWVVPIVLPVLFLAKAVWRFLLLCQCFHCKR